MPKMLRLKLLAAAALVSTPAFAQSPPPAPAQNSKSGDPAAGAEQPPAEAFDILAPVVVTARRREERLQDVPAAVSALTGAQLAAQQINRQVDLQYHVPSLSLQGRYGHQGGTYSIRGLAGPTSGNPSVGTYFAEVPSPVVSLGYDGAAGQSLYDLESVQVLKGPQGTLFGRTSTAGAVLVYPKRPSLTAFEGQVDLVEGTQGREEVTAAVNVPIVTDRAAVRFAFQRQHLDGYTKILNTGQSLDETNTTAFRISLELKPTSWLRNTLIYDSYQVDEAPAAFIPAAYNPNLAVFNLPANTPAFNAACAGAVATGNATSVSGCVADRLSTLAKIKSDLAAEVARQNGGGDARRYTNSDNNAYEIERSNHRSLINTTEVALPDWGEFTSSLKNIFGYQYTDGVTGLNGAGIPDDHYIQYSGLGNGASLNQARNLAVVGLGAGNDFYSNETQFAGSFAGKRLQFVTGYFYQRAPAVQDSDGVSIIAKTLGGVTTVNSGFTATTPFTVAGRSVQNAYYGSATLSLDGLLNGVHVTAGGRHTVDKSSSTTANAVTNYVTGVFTPSATTTSTALKTSGTNYTFSIDYRATPDLLIYATTRRGYVPGGINAITGGTGLPNFSPIFGSETIKDVEFGLKWEGEVAGMRGRLNLDYYRDWYDNIQRTFSGLNTGGTVVTYIANVAEAKLEGVEIEALIEPVDAITLGVNYSYNDAGYVRWVGADPYNVAPAGTILDLTNNPFPNAPRNKVNFNATYRIPLENDQGNVAVTATYAYQSRSYFSSAPQRTLDIYGPGVLDATSQKAYALINLRADWTDVMGKPGLNAGLFVRNLTDKIYATSGLMQLNSLGIATKTYGEPRTAGFSLSYAF